MKAGGKLASRKYQAARRGIKGISAAKRSGDAKRLPGDELPAALSSAGGSWSLGRGGVPQGCGLSGAAPE